MLQLQVWSLFLLQEGGAIQWDPIHLWAQMGNLAKGVVILLFIMSAYSIGELVAYASGSICRSLRILAVYSWLYVVQSVTGRRAAPAANSPGARSNDIRVM